MSDTPRTDAKAFDITTGNPDADGVVMADFARDLERENAALADENRRLHVELDAYHNGEQLRKLRAEVNVTRQNYESYKADNIGLRAAIAESEEFARKNGETLATKVRELLAENAALREDKERLDWLETNGREQVYGPTWRIAWQFGQDVSLRAVIDASRREAQP